MLARLRTASGSATLTRILIRKAAGWAMMGGLRKTTPATITIGGGAIRTQNMVVCAGTAQGRTPRRRRAVEQTSLEGLKVAATFHPPCFLPHETAGETLHWPDFTKQRF